MTLEHTKKVAQTFPDQQSARDAMLKLDTYLRTVLPVGTHRIVKLDDKEGTISKSEDFQDSWAEFDQGGFQVKQASLHTWYSGSHGLQEFDVSVSYNESWVLSGKVTGFDGALVNTVSEKLQEVLGK